MLRGCGTLKYGDVHEKLNIFQEIQEIRPLRTCQNILKQSYRIFFQMEITQWYKFFHVATAMATTLYHNTVNIYEQNYLENNL